MKIIRISDTLTYVWELAQALHDNNIKQGDRFGISWKDGKRRKLKAYHLDDFNRDNCDNCGDFTVITLRKGTVSKTFDNHLGSSQISMF